MSIIEKAIINSMKNQPYNYYIYKNSGTYYAKNGVTGKVAYSGTDFATVVQSAIDAVSPTFGGYGGTVFISEGFYDVTKPILMRYSVYLKGAGRGSAQFVSNGECKGGTVLNNVQTDGEPTIRCQGGTFVFGGISDMTFMAYHSTPKSFTTDIGVSNTQFICPGHAVGEKNEGTVALIGTSLPGGFVTTSTYRARRIDDDHFELTTHDNYAGSYAEEAAKTFSSNGSGTFRGHNALSGPAIECNDPPWPGMNNTIASPITPTTVVTGSVGTRIYEHAVTVKYTNGRAQRIGPNVITTGPDTLNTTNYITVSWTAPPAHPKWGAVTGYRVYRLRKYNPWTINSGAVLDCTNHGFSTTNTVRVSVSAGGALPSPLVAGTTYYVRNLSTSTISLHPTAADATNNTNAITPTGGSGTFYIHSTSGTGKMSSQGTTLSYSDKGAAPSTTYHDLPNSYTVTQSLAVENLTIRQMGGDGILIGDHTEMYDADNDGIDEPHGTINRLEMCNFNYITSQGNAGCGINVAGHATGTMFYNLDLSMNYIDGIHIDSSYGCYCTVMQSEWTGSVGWYSDGEDTTRGYAINLGGAAALGTYTLTYAANNHPHNRTGSPGAYTYEYGPAIRNAGQNNIIYSMNVTEPFGYPSYGLSNTENTFMVGGTITSKSVNATDLKAGNVIPLGAIRPTNGPSYNGLKLQKFGCYVNEDLTLAKRFGTADVDPTNDTILLASGGVGNGNAIVLNLVPCSFGNGTTTGTSTGHGFTTGDEVTPWKPCSSALTYGSNYYVRVLTTGTFTLHPTLDDANNNTNAITFAGGYYNLKLTSVLPGGLVAGKQYYAYFAGQNKIKIREYSQDGAFNGTNGVLTVVDLTDAGTGTGNCFSIAISLPAHSAYSTVAQVGNFDSTTNYGLQMFSKFGYNQSQFSLNDTAPSVANANIYKTRASVARTITTFTGGSVGQELIIFATDANTTIKHDNNANGTGPILLKDGVDRRLALNEVICFRMFDDGVWREIIGTRAIGHNGATGLQGGTTDEYYHLTSAEYTSLTSAKSGLTSFSGDDNTATFNIAHGCSGTPTDVVVTPASGDAASDHYYIGTVTSTNIPIVFITPPKAGTNNIKFYWRAK